MLGEMGMSHEILDALECILNSSEERIIREKEKEREKEREVEVVERKVERSEYSLLIIQNLIRPTPYPTESAEKNRLISFIPIQRGP